MIQKKIKRFICQNQIVYYLLSPVIFVRRFLINTRNKFMIGIFRKIFTKVESGYVLVRLPEFFGSFNMDVRSHIFRRIALYGEYENDVRNLVIDHLDVNRDAIDVGANVGLFSVSIAYQLSEGHKVLAIEPTSGAMTLLRKNIEQNGVFDSVIVYHGAVSDHSGLVSLNVAEGNEEYSSIGEIGRASCRERV